MSENHHPSGDSVVPGPRPIEVTRKDGSSFIVEGVTHLEMDGPLFLWRDETLLYGVADGEWDHWNVAQGVPR